MSWDLIKLVDYPIWVRILGVIWLIATCALSCALVLARPTPGPKDPALKIPTQTAISTGENSPVVQTGANSNVTLHIGDKRVSERPWLTIEKVELLEGNVRVGSPLRIQIKWKNTGTTPALNVRSQCVAESMRGGSKPTYNYDRWPPKSTSVMGVGTEMTAVVSATGYPDGRVAPLLKEGFDMLVKKTALVFAHGRITYEDISGQAHWTDFCFLLNVLPTGEYTWEVFGEHNEVNRN